MPRPTVQAETRIKDEGVRAVDIDPVEDVVLTRGPAIIEAAP